MSQSRQWSNENRKDFSIGLCESTKNLKQATEHCWKRLEDTLAKKSLTRKRGDFDDVVRWVWLVALCANPSRALSDVSSK